MLTYIKFQIGLEITLFFKSILMLLLFLFFQWQIQKLVHNINEKE